MVDTSLSGRIGVWRPSNIIGWWLKELGTIQSRFSVGIRKLLHSLPYLCWELLFAYNSILALARIAEETRTEFEEIKQRLSSKSGCFSIWAAGSQPEIEGL